VHAQNTNTSNTPGILKYLKSVVLGEARQLGR
jgi:hypothetical protein